MDYKYEPTEEEIQANIAKAEAEAKKALAEARREDALAVQSELDAEDARRRHERKDASDDRHRVYRFTTNVSGSSARDCMSTLTRWSRLDPECEMEIVFNSPGGDIFNGLAMFDHIRQLSADGHHITTGAQGTAASMAGILLQAGDHRWVSNQAWVLIHRASFGTQGSTYEVEDRMEHVKRIEKRIIDIFERRSDGAMTAQRIRANWKRKDWWLTSEQCLEFGLVDEVRSDNL